MQFPLRSLRAVVSALVLAAIFPTVVFAQKPSVLLLAAEPRPEAGQPVESGGAEQVRARLEGTFLFAKVDLIHIDEPNSTPTLQTLLGYDAVLTWTDLPYDAPAAVGDVLAQYVDAGHGVVLAAFSLFNDASLNLCGRWSTEGYDPLTHGGIAGFPGLMLRASQPGHPILDGVFVFSGDTQMGQSGMTLVPGAELVADWTNGEPLVAVLPGPHGGRVVGLNLYPVFTTDDVGTFLIANALVFAGTQPAVTNHAPTANAGFDKTLEATGPVTAFTLTGAGSDQDGDALAFSWSVAGTASGSSLTGTLPVGVHTITLTVSDGKGGSASDDVVVTVTDLTGPVLANMPAAVVTAAATSASGADVPYGPVTAADAVDGSTVVSCSKSGVFPIGDTLVTCSSSDSRHHSTSASFTVRVLDVTTPGTMWGEGTIRVGTVRNEVEFAVGERARLQGALLQLRVKDEEFPHKSGDRFTARTTNFVAFTNDPSVRPGSARVDTVVFSGYGDWNGRSGYQYQMSAVDKREAGCSRMQVKLTITAANGAVVARFDGTLGNGGTTVASALRR